jgi:hypothetical protein
MKKQTVILAVSVLFGFLCLSHVSFAKDVTVTGSVTAVEDEGKSVTLKTDAGEELTCKVSSKRTKFSKKDLAVGKKVTLVYDDENPAKEAKTIAAKE